jgi:hypothetical protein
METIQFYNHYFLYTKKTIRQLTDGFLKVLDSLPIVSKIMGKVPAPVCRQAGSLE